MNAVTCGVSAPENGAAIAGPGGEKMTLGNVSAGQVVTEQLNVC